MWFPDVTASVFFEVPAVAAADVFGYYIFESYADAAALNYARGALFIISVGNSILHWDKRYTLMRRDSVWNYVRCRWHGSRASLAGET